LRVKLAEDVARLLVALVLVAAAGCGHAPAPQGSRSSDTAPPARADQGPTVDLIAYWPLDGELNDAAPAGESKDNGKVVGTATFENGKLGKGIVLDGSNHVEIPTSPDLEARDKSISISAWFRVEDWPGRYETVLAKGRGDRYSIAHHAIDPDRLAYFGGLRKDPLDAPAGGPVNDGLWHHVVAITEAGTRTLIFIDGVLLKTGGADTATLGESGRPLMLGNNPERSREDRHWIGGIDDVGLFSGALNASEARAIYTLATSPALGHDLGSATKLIQLHRRQSPAPVTIGNQEWKYASRDPGDGQPFIVLSENGSGVTTSPRPSVVSFATSHRFLDSGNSAQLRWSVTENATEVRITPLAGQVVHRSGTLRVTPTETTRYEITARNEQGTCRATTTVHVDYRFGRPRISEFMANNAPSDLDDDGESSDWIELHNPGPGLANTADLFLTDDIDKPTKWPVPGMIMERDESVVIFASGKDRRDINSQLHTNFRLRANGEYLALVHSTGTTTEMVSFFGRRYPAQKRGVSFGVDTGGATGPLSAPTPSNRNTEVVTGRLNAVRFSHKRSLCASPFRLILTSESPTSVIYFTTNGTSPTPTTGRRYRDPIAIESTTVIRAAAFRQRMRRSLVSTHTYIFPETVIRQPGHPAGFPEKWETFPADYAMDPRVTEDPAYRADLLKGLRAIPTMSVSMPQADLFGPRGIYSHPMDHGKDWERASSLELIQPDGTEGFQIDCGLRIYGGFGRNRRFPKHSLRVLFKGIYGATRLNFPVFPDATTSFDTLILRGGFNNSWQAGSSRSQHLRDEFIRRSQLAMGQPASHGMFVHLYLNGLYWGVYNLVERPSGAFAAAYLGGERDEYDALNSGKAIDGTTEAWREMHDVARKSTPENVLETLGPFVNLDNLIDYMLVNFYGGNDDWDGHNWYAARKREPGAGYHFFCWDSERTLENAAGDNKTRTNNGNNPSGLFNQLLRHPAFRQRVLSRVRLHCFDNGVLTPSRAAARYAAMATQISDAIVAESARWGDAQRDASLTRNDDWIPERDRLLKTWFPKRTGVLLEQLNAVGNLGYIKSPDLKAIEDSIEILATTGTVYFTTDGSDPRRDDGTPNPTATIVKGFTVENELLPRSSEWKYLDNGSDQGTAWRKPGFDDSGWKSGKARLGYGNDGEITKLEFGPDENNKHITTYFRRLLVLPETGTFDFIKLLLSRDDGAVVYLNGSELLRSNMPPEGEITFSTRASRTHDDHKFFEYTLPRKLLKAGMNIIAAEVHQGTPQSSDTGFDLALQGIKQNRTLIPTASLRTLKARTYANGAWSSLSRYPGEPRK
jgi:hypothetical protein